MAALLAGLGSGAGIGGLAAGAAGGGGLMGAIGSFLGSSLMGDANKDTNGMAGQAMSSLSPTIPTTPATPNTQPGQGSTATDPSTNPLLNFLTPYQSGQQMGFSQLQSQLLGK